MKTFDLIGTMRSETRPKVGPTQPTLTLWHLFDFWQTNLALSVCTFQRRRECVRRDYVTS